MVFLRTASFATAALLVWNAAVAAPLPLAEANTHVATTHQHLLHQQAVNLQTSREFSNKKKHLQHVTVPVDDADIHDRGNIITKHRSDDAAYANLVAAHANRDAADGWQEVVDKTDHSDMLHHNAIANVGLHRAKWYSHNLKQIAHSSVTFGKPNNDKSFKAAQKSTADAQASLAKAKAHLQKRRYADN